MKHIQVFTLLFVLCIGSNTHAQILKTTNLNLNTGGKINDVAYDSYYDAYIVVGDFSSVNGQSRNNLAFIDASTFAVMPQNPILSIDGEIRTIEFYSAIPLFTSFGGDPLNPDGRKYYMYLGGNFGTINGVTLPYLARFSASHYYANPPVGGLATYGLNSSWSLNGIFGVSNSELGVHDLNLDADTLVVVGQFYSQKPYYPSTQRNFITAYDVTSSSNDGWLNIFPSSIAALYNDYTVFTIEKFDNQYYLTINEEVFRYTSQGINTTPNYDYFQSNGGGSQNRVRHVGFNVSNFGDTVMYSAYGLHLNGFGIEMDSMYQVNNNYQNITVWDAFDFELYKDIIYSCHSSTSTSTSALLTKERNGLYSIGSSGSISLNQNWQPSISGSFPQPRKYESIFQRNDMLFLSGSNLTSVNGTSRTGLAVFCLEPRGAEPFYLSTQTACETETAFYAVPQVDFADGYQWTYTGSGALYRITGSGNPWAALSTHLLHTTSGNSIQIQFPSGSTGGTLTVEPFTVCNTTTDYQFGESQAIPITVNPLPDVSLPASYGLNCYSDTVNIVVQSTNPNAQFVWSFNGTSANNDTIIITKTDTVIFSGVYSVLVTDSLTGCSNSGSTVFSVDTIATPIDPYLTTTDPLEWNCLTDSMTLTSNINGYSVIWEDQANLGTFYTDPYVIHAVPSSLFNIHGTQFSNGCAAQAEYGGVIVNIESAEPNLIGHPNFLTDLPDDSLSCLTPSISLQCDVESAYTGLATAQWWYQGTPLGTDIVNITTADSTGMDAFNLKYYTILTTHLTSQCLDSTTITVRFDYETPFIPTLADQSINCSQSEITLTHPTNGSSNIIEGWLDGSSSQTGVDTIIAIFGDYYYQVLDTENGCVNTDTVSVTQTLDLIIEMPLDTLICPDEIVLITPTIIGNSETPSYLWSTGSTSASESATGGIDSELSVTVTTPNGCVGTDTTTISITLPINATITPIAGCTDGNLEVTSITGGAGNYQYALDGSTWQTSTTFGGLAFDDYTISVLDDLGCVYDFDQTLDGTASSVEMQFAVSTYNEEGDTIVLVNITDFTGLDSIGWGLPTNANVFYEEDSTVILSIATGGWYDVDLYGYLGSNCVYTYTTSVYFGTEAPVFDETYTSNGIQSFVVSPNPTTAQFDVDLEFGTAQNYSIIVTNSLGQPIAGMGVSAVGTIVNHSFQFPLGTPAGSYRIHVIADYDAQQKMIILN